MPEHCTCLLRNLYADQEATEQDMEQWTGSKLGKEYVKAVCCHPAYSTNMQTTSCKILSWTNHKVELRWLEEITTSDVQMADILVAESEEQLKSLLMKVREESEKPGLKLNNPKKKKKDYGIVSHHFMAKRRSKSGYSGRFYFLDLQNYCAQ